MDHQHRFDLVIEVAAEFLLHLRRIHSVPPIAWGHIYAQAEIRGHLGPEGRETDLFRRPTPDLPR